MAGHLNLRRRRGRNPVIHARLHDDVIALVERARIGRIGLVAHAVGQGTSGHHADRFVGRVVMRRHGVARGEFGADDERAFLHRIARNHSHLDACRKPRGACVHPFHGFGLGRTGGSNDET